MIIKAVGVDHVNGAVGGLQLWIQTVESEEEANVTQANAGPVLTISYIKEEGFKPTLKCGKGFYLLDPNWKMVVHQRIPITESSTSDSACVDYRNHYELFKIGWCLAIQGFVDEGKDFKLYSQFHREKMQRS